MTDARSPEHDHHPLRGRWRPASPYVWGGHVSPQFVMVLVLAHAVVAGWFVSDWDQARMVLYDFHEVHSEAVVNAPPEALTRAYGYAEDPVDALRRYKVIAAPIVAGATTAGERARRLGDYIYSLRSPVPWSFDEDLRYGPDVLFERMQAGAHANCGQMSAVLATFWRSLGGHTRGVRFGTHRGAIGHYAVELWDADRGQWFYYDMNLNGFAHNDDGVTPLSVAALRANLLTGEDLHITANATQHDFTPDQLAATVREFPQESYVLNNTYLRWSREQRFGLFNRFYPALAALPHPWDRVVDNLTGGRDSRLIVEGRFLVAGLFSFRAARVFVAYLAVVILVGLITLQRTRSARRAGMHPPMAADTPPSQ